MCALRAHDLLSQKHGGGWEALNVKSSSKDGLCSPTSIHGDVVCQGVARTSWLYLLDWCPTPECQTHRNVAVTSHDMTVCKAGSFAIVTASWN